MKNLVNVVEAIIFAAGVPISRQDILNKLPDDVSKRNLNDAISELEEKYSGDCGIRLEIFNDKVQFASNSQYGEIVADVLQPVKEKELSKILVEVLSIIAYQQPITRSEIEDIRGVSPDYAISVLLKADLIKSCGFKQSPGKPVLYGTTDEFLKKFELHSIDELPDYGEVMKRLIEYGNFNAQTEGLYREIQVADDFEETSSQIQQQDEFDALLDSTNPDFLSGEEFVSYESDGDSDDDDTIGV
ncbi:MAG: SMC-Scp complex subunit ScpB [Christensenellales bacterium]